AILHSLYDLARERTTIMIAHRLSTVVDADEIIVLDGGQIAERGDHASLIAQGGLYADLWDKQSAVQEAERIIADTAAE
ncbi:MAG: metal ABC transporter permease, partial [Pseudomonadota bacterium]